MKHHWAAWQQMAAEYQVALTVEKLLSLAGKPSKAILELLLHEQGIEGLDIDAAVARKQELYLAQADDTTPIEAVFRIARAGKARGLPMAVATGGSRRQVTKAMAASGLSDFFGAVVTADDITNGKPHPETFLRAAELIGVDPAGCVGYEDAPLGMDAIKAAGFLKAVDVTVLEGYPRLV
jgi:HAD superfamily hydrolase (TIGR01509 family)